MSDKGADFKTETVVHQTCKRNGESKTKQSTKENSDMQTYVSPTLNANERITKKIDKTTISTLRLTPVTPGVQSPVSLWHTREKTEKMPILIFRQRYLIVGQS